MKWGQLLKQLTTLRVYKAKHGHAPHKPLLLLVFIELAQHGKLTQILRLTPELAYRFDCFWKVVAHRRTQMTKAEDGYFPALRKRRTKVSS